MPRSHVTYKHRFKNEHIYYMFSPPTTSAPVSSEGGADWLSRVDNHSDDSLQAATLDAGADTEVSSLFHTPREFGRFRRRISEIASDLDLQRSLNVALFEAINEESTRHADRLILLSGRIVKLQAFCTAQTWALAALLLLLFSLWSVLAAVFLLPLALYMAQEVRCRC